MRTAAAVAQFDVEQVVVDLRTIALSGTLSSIRVGVTTAGEMLRGLTKPAVPGFGIAVSAKNREGCPVAVPA